MIGLQQDSTALVTLGRVAKRFGCSNRTVQRMVERGTLPAIRIPGTRDFRFRQSEVDSLIERSAWTGKKEVAA